MKNPPVPPPFTQRSALLLMGAVLCALVIGVLTFFAVGNAAAAVVSGLIAFGGAFTFLHNHIR
ncbi:hypothetical protein [Umezawaea sp. Da 62-37]|uniref:hypothetical protein n=1 Tax=Umezawaea sp. Da 62-37 TaxID=3075927 RepID=UPI0028F72DE9|nr:hypothetical protein [Umezawaea sp. Da 62-37]WNV88129.1 hypothetical protein RM788_07515 [Umezawaea sp. Da 62-37]